MKISPISYSIFPPKTKEINANRAISFKEKQDEVVISKNSVEMQNKIKETLKAVETYIKTARKTAKVAYKNTIYCFKIGKEQNYQGYIDPHLVPSRERIKYEGKNEKTGLPTQIVKYDLSRNFQELQRYEIPESLDEGLTFTEIKPEEDYSFTIKQKGLNVEDIEIRSKRGVYTHKEHIVPSKTGYTYTSYLINEENVALPIVMLSVDKNPDECCFIRLNKELSYDIYYKSRNAWLYSETIENLNEILNN